MDIKAGVKEFLKDKWNIAFLIILVIAAAIRIQYMINDSMWPDEALYTWYGYKLLHSPSYLFSQEFTHTISYFPSIIIAILSIFFSSFVAGKIMSLLFGLAGITAAYFLGREIKDGFTGLIAAILISFNFIHWFYSDRVLLDVPLTTMFTIAAYFLLRYDKNPGKKTAIWLAISMALTMYTKLTGLLIVPIVGLYFLLSHQKNVFSLFKRKDFITLIVLFIIFVLPLFIINFVNFGGPLVESGERYVSSDDAGANRLKPSVDLLAVLGWYVMVPAIIGLILAFVYRKKEHYLLIAWLAGIYLFFTILHPQSLDRYMLPAAVPLFLLAAIFIDELKMFIEMISKKTISKWIFVIIALLIILPGYLAGNNQIKISSYTYTGFSEAGNWLRDNAEENAAIMTYSTRALRVFSLKEFEENNGVLKSQARTKEEFEKQLENEALPVYLVVDAWEYIQPEWVYPLTQEKIDYITSQGFEPVNIVNKRVPTDKGLQEYPVVIIFKKGE